MNTLTKYERVRVIGERAQQIAKGAPALVDITGITNSLDIAKKEYISGVIPITIIRTYPNGKTKEIIPTIENQKY